MKNNPLKFKNNKNVEETKEVEVENVAVETDLLNRAQQTIADGIITIENASKDLYKELNVLYTKKLSKKSKKQIEEVKDKLELAKHVSKYWVKKFKNKFID